LIGQGGYADVFRGKDSNTGQIVAIKRFKNSYSDVRIQFENEISVLTRCKHSNLVSMIGYSNDGSQFCLVYEFMSNGSLQDHLSSQKDSNNSLDMHRRLSILKDVAKGIDYLHKNNFIHRDIKSANILLNEQFEAKLGDYGITKLLSENCTHAFTSMIVGTTVYMAPEYILDGKVSAKTDVYSYGVVLLELLTGLPAYDQRRDEHSLVIETIDTWTV
jgi:interleukin-1 receptor-associated kinase 4